MIEVFQRTEPELLAFLVEVFRYLQIAVFALSPIIYGVWARKRNVNKWGYRFLAFPILFVLSFSIFIFIGSYSRLFNILGFYISIFLSLILTIRTKDMIVFMLIMMIPSFVVDTCIFIMDFTARAITEDECAFVASSFSLVPVNAFSCRNSIKAHIAAEIFALSRKKNSCPKHWWDSRDLICLRNLVSEEEVNKEMEKCSMHTATKGSEKLICDQEKVDHKLKQLIIRCELNRPIWHGCGPLFD
jgi:hypothetical protein